MTPKLEAHLLFPRDYSDVLTYTKDLIDFHHVYAVLKHQEQRRLERVDLTLFVVVQGDQRLYCVIHELLRESVKILINTDSQEDQFVREATLAVMDKAYPILNKYDSFYSAYIRRDIRKIMLTHPASIQTHPFQPMDEPNQCFYVNEERCKKLANELIELPEDYYFTELQEKDAQQICREQIYTSQKDEKFIELRLRNFPAVGAAYKPLGAEAEAPGNLACYEYSDGLGVISLLYCQKQHRGRRLATLVEEKICQRNLIEWVLSKKLEIRPYKGVSINRPRVIQMTEKSELWTAYKDVDHTNEIYYCSLWCREDRPRVVIYED